ncbi:MAG: Diguanylate cyclase/phosphodiesterase domain 2 [Clostridiaceae bacterium]|jgi:diguanylate cyclase (GGDEF)-like protein/PAS domain S-box-containing protein|nr:Diguanylate cyclase/phosphodiesterase domain 2 [Clostridiaceae bacterium]
MRKKIQINIMVFNLIILFLLLFNTTPVFAKDMERTQKNILIIHSYNENFIWTRDIMSGINSVIDDSSKNFNVYIDYMDLKKINNNAYIENFYSLEKSKYKNIKLDVIICSDDGALNYLLKYRDSIFSKVPVVFCGINSLNSSLANKENLYTGITENISAEDMLKTITFFHPELKTLNILVGSTETGKITEDEIKNAYKKMGLHFQCNYFIDTNVDKAKELIRSSDKDTAFLFAGDPITDYLNSPKYIRTIKDEFFNTTSIPLYSFWDFDIGYGAVGGKLISGFNQGKTAGDIALKILNGYSISNIDPVTSDNNKYIFDYNKITKFKISIKNLPEDSVIVNKPFSFYEEYKPLVITAAIILSLLIIIIIILMFFAKHKSESERQINSSYEELSSVYEELAATEEELRTQFDELQESEELVRNSEERFRLAVAGSNDAIFELDCITDKIFLSDTWTEISGYPIKTNSLFMGYWSKCIMNADLKRLIHEFHNSIRENKDFLRSEFRLKVDNGQFKWILFKGKILMNEQGKPVKMSGSLTDISDRKNYEQKIKHMAYYDSLTNLPNRTLFIEKLNELINCKNIGAVLFLDLDEFKKINDTLGHQYGDELLVQISNKLNSLISANSIVSRFGGDEYLILLPYVKQYDEAADVCYKIMDIFKTPFIINHISNYVTASIGITMFPYDGNHVDLILKNADTAMYKAKENGRNQFCFFNQIMGDELLKYRILENELRDAIKNNELMIYYQPQININNNYIIGMEALIRWNNSKLGFILPNDFIPMSEKTGMIIEIGTWIFQNVCNQIKRWKAKNYKFDSIAINISPIQLKQHNFLDIFTKIIKNIDFPANLIELEITENVLINSLDDNIKKINYLKQLGIKIALDDFGTGFSSLNYLRILPIDKLKIDKSFIDGICSETQQKLITEEIIQLSHKLNYSVVAEGVETEEQVNTLKHMKCDYAQGYYFSKPVPAEAIEEILKRNNY